MAIMRATVSAHDPWPRLSHEEIWGTADHLHRLAQIGGKYTLDQPFEPNWGNIMLSVTPRGFSTPTLHAGRVPFLVDYELLDDRVTVSAASGRVSLPLGPGTVAGFYERFVESVAQLGIAPLRTTVEPEIPDAPTLDTDWQQRPYDGQAARRLWSAFASAASVLTAWQAPYRGHRHRVGIMWGEFDLSATRYSGRLITPPSTKPVFQQNGMTGEVVALGFSLGDERSRSAAFYAYISPAPDGIETADFGVEGAAYVSDSGLIILPWDIVRASDDPHAAVLRFADAVYDAAIDLGGWPTDLSGPRHDGWYASNHRVFKQ
jgi:hypothetical protein